jgi:hypothetical protein
MAALCEEMAERLRARRGPRQGKHRRPGQDLRTWAATLNPTDQVALQATKNSDAIAMLLEPLMARVVVSNLRKTGPSPRRRGSVGYPSDVHIPGS